MPRMCFATLDSPACSGAFEEDLEPYRDDIRNALGGGGICGELEAEMRRASLAGSEAEEAAANLEMSRALLEACSAIDRCGAADEEDVARMMPVVCHRLRLTPKAIAFHAPRLLARHGLSGIRKILEAEIREIEKEIERINAGAGYDMVGAARARLAAATASSAAKVARRDAARSRMRGDHPAARAYASRQEERAAALEVDAIRYGEEEKAALSVSKNFPVLH